MKAMRIFLLTLSGIAMISCGGSGGGGSDPDPVIISADNEADLGRAAASAVSQIAAMNDASGSFGPNLGARNRSDKTGLATGLSARLALAPEPLQECDSGSATIDVSTSGNTGEILYDQCETSGTTVDGQITFGSSTSGTITTTRMEFNDFSVSSEGIVEAFEFTVICTINTEPLEISCTFESTITGLDGRSFAISNASVSGSEFSGFTVSVTIEDPDHGIFDISTSSPLTFNCTDGDQPDSGQIRFTDSEGTLVTVTYNDCSSFTVSHSGGSNLYNW